MPYPQAYQPATNSYFLYTNPRGKRRLSPSFTAGPYDVICCRGKAAYNHEGNRRFRTLVKLNQEAYASASSKYQKSQIVSHITNTVREASQEGGFVKLIKGTYYEVGDRAAKEKIGQTFRDLLHTKYSSSTKAKARTRIQKRTNIAGTDAAQNDPTPQHVQSSHLADNINSSLSIVSNEEYHQDGMADVARPPFVDITCVITPREQQKEASWLDTLYTSMFPSQLEIERLPIDLEPLPIQENMIPVIECNDRNSEWSSLVLESFDDDLELEKFCEQYIETLI